MPTPQAAGNELPIHRHFDLIAGTSTGGLFALALGLRGLELPQVYIKSPARGLNTNYMHGTCAANHI